MASPAAASSASAEASTSKGPAPGPSTSTTKKESVAELEASFDDKEIDRILAAEATGLQREEEVRAVLCCAVCRAVRPTSSDRVSRRCMAVGRAIAAV